MVTKRTIVRAVVVVEVTWYHIVMIVVPIDFGGVIVVVTRLVAGRSLVMITMVAVGTMVTVGYPRVIRRIPLSKLNAQAPRAEREALCFGCWGVSNGHQANCKDGGDDPFYNGGHGNYGLG